MSNSELLNQLRIDRDAEPEPRPWKRYAGLLVLALLVVGGWMFAPRMTEDSMVPVLEVRTAIAAVTAPTGPSVLDASGYVVARRQATVSAKVTGKVIQVLIEEGIEVVEGQLLARLDSTIPRAQLELTRSRVNAARTGLEEIRVSIAQAQLNLDRTRELTDRKLASQADLDRDSLLLDASNARLATLQDEVAVAESSLKLQQHQVDDFDIRAPFSGVVIAKAAQPGEMISPISAGGGFTRTGICTIVDMASLEVEVDVNESYINRVRAGQPVSVALNAYPQDTVAAHVIAIIPAADRSKATVRVRIGFDERDPRILPDMGVKVSFLESSAQAPNTLQDPSVITIPASAIHQGAVYVVANGAVELRSVDAAPGGERWARIRQGLAPGERFVENLDAPTLARLAEGTGYSIVN